MGECLVEWYQGMSGFYTLHSSTTLTTVAAATVPEVREHNLVVPNKSTHLALGGVVERQHAVVVAVLSLDGGGHRAAQLAQLAAHRIAVPRVHVSVWNQKENISISI